jgi:hypothetical protein
VAEGHGHPLVLYIKVTVMSVCPGSFQALLRPFFFFFLMGFVFNWGGASRGSAQAKGGTGGEGSGGGGQHGSRGGTGEEVPSGGGTGGEGPGGVGGTGEEGPGEGKLDGCIMHQVHTSIYKFACLSVSLSVEVLKPSVRLSRS